MNKPYITKYIFVLELVSYFLLLVSFVLSIVTALTADGEIPTHYDIAGNIDGYGSPWTLLLMPGIILFTFAIMTISLHFVSASKWNLGNVKVTAENALPLYIEVGKMNVELMLIIGIYTFVFTALWCAGVMKHITLMTVIFCVVLFADIIIRCIRMNRYK